MKRAWTWRRSAVSSFSVYIETSGCIFDPELFKFAHRTRPMPRERLRLLGHVRLPVVTYICLHFYWSALQPLSNQLNWCNSNPESHYSQMRWCEQSWRFRVHFIAHRFWCNVKWIHVKFVTNFDCLIFSIYLCFLHLKMTCSGRWDPFDLRADYYFINWLFPTNSTI